MELSIIFRTKSKNPDQFTAQHPLAFFFRKTFNKVVKASMESSKQEVVKNMIIDEISQQEIDKFTKMKTNYLKLAEGKKVNLKRKIVLGSSVAMKILNEDTDKLNKMR